MVDISLLIEKEAYPKDDKGRSIVKNRKGEVFIVLCNDFYFNGISNYIVYTDRKGSLCVAKNDGTYIDAYGTVRPEWDLMPPEPTKKVVSKYLVLNKYTGEYLTAFDSIERANEQGYGTEKMNDLYVLVPVEVPFEVSWPESKKEVALPSVNNKSSFEQILRQRFGDAVIDAAKKTVEERKDDGEPGSKE